jgi:hypothetical protein
MRPAEKAIIGLKLRQQIAMLQKGCDDVPMRGPGRTLVKSGCL